MILLESNKTFRESQECLECLKTLIYNDNFLIKVQKRYKSNKTYKTNVRVGTL